MRYTIMREHWERNARQVPDPPAKRSGGGKWGSREAGVAWRDALLTAVLLGGWKATDMAGCLTDNPQSCSRNVFKAQSWHSAIHPDDLKVNLVSLNGGSLGGDGVAELVRVCWVSHGQLVLSDLRIRPRGRQFEETNIYSKNRGQANDRSREGRGQ
jgi:hypothetical protein